MKNLFILVLLVTLFSCSGKAPKYVCNCEQSSRVQAFVERSLAPANNKSDEEMEDVIRELFKTGVKLNCSQKLIDVADGEIDWTKTVPQPCETIYNLYEIL